MDPNAYSLAKEEAAGASAHPRLLQSGGNFSDYAADYYLFFGLQLVFFVTVPLTIMLWRLARSARNKSCGFMSMLRAPLGRVGDKRSPAAALRFFLFQETQLGYYADLAQVRPTPQAEATSWGGWGPRGED